MIVRRPDSTLMVRVRTSANWTRDVEIVQEADMERSISKDEDTITQSTMADRLAGMGTQMLGRSAYHSSGSSSSTTPQVA